MIKVLFLATLFILPLPFTAQAQQTVFVPSCNGTASDQTNISAIITATSPNDATIRLPWKANTAKRCKITTATIPSRITLDNTDGSGIYVVTSLSHAGPRVNPIGKTMFFGPGAVTLTGGTYGSEEAGTIDVTKSPYNADNTCATDASVAINAALAAAAVGSVKRVRAPKGCYSFNPAGGFTGALLSIGGNGVELYGDGAGQTIFQMPNSITLAAFGHTIQVTGSDVRVHHITWKGPSTVTNNDSWDMINITSGYRVEIDHNELYNLNGNSGQTAGMPGISSYQLQVAEVNTTLGSTIVAGTRTVTPASMNGIYVGRPLVIGGSAETVIVTAATATTFTAVFVNAHSSSDTVKADYAQQNYLNVHDNYLHDSLIASGIVINSSGGTFRNNTIIRVGNSSARHGFYVQAGNNLIEGNWAEGIGGYSYHQHCDTAYTDCSQNRYIGNTSLNPATAHFNADTDTSNGTNPVHPNTTSLSRQLVVANNTFRSDIGSGGAPLFISMPVAFIANLLENTTGVSGTAGSVFANNTMAQTTTISSDHAIQMLGANSLAINNTVLNWTATTAVIRADAANSKIIGNTVTANASRIFSGSAEIASNVATITGDSSAFADIDAASVNIHHNTVTASGVTMADVYSTASGVISDNTFIGTGLRIFNPGGIAKGLIISGNTIATLVNNAFVQKPSMGRLLQVQNGNVTANAFGGTGWGYLVKLNSSGELDVVKTTDSVFAGVSLNNYSNGQTFTTGALIAGYAPGLEFDGMQTDGAWTVGHIGIVSTSTDGKIHDTGSVEIPPLGSCVQFLDSGGGVGTARVLIVRVNTTSVAPTSPAQITSNQNNYNPGGKSEYIKITTDASRNLTGLTFTPGQKDGEKHTVVNIGLNDAVLKHQDAGSSAANRFFNSTAADITLTPKQAADLIYDATNSYWLVYKKN